MSDRIAIAAWGKDHWSTLLYLETVVIYHNGCPDMARMRSKSDIRRGWNYAQVVIPTCNNGYPTRILIRDPNDWETIIGRPEVHDHDDWDCVDDMEAEGLLTQKGTGLQPIVDLTDYGYAVVAALKKNGGDFRTLKLPDRATACAV